MSKGLTIGTIATRIAARRLARFRADEDGSLMILSLQIFLLMLVTTGIAIDFSRQEERRELIQNTIDRAVLAAASLSQDIDPKLVVKDYLAKAGLGHLDVDPKVEEGTNGEWRRVTVVVKDRMPTVFGNLVGVTELSAKGNSRAEESVGTVEISMVLDVSGSMNNSVAIPQSCTSNCTSMTRLDWLKIAARGFIEKMFDVVQPAGAPAGRLSINIVPYSSNVYLGTDMQQAYKLSNDYSIINSNFWQAQCADFNATDMAQIPIDGTQTLTRTMYGSSSDLGDTIGESSWYSYTANPPNETWNNCFNYSQNRVIPLGNNESALLTYIQGLTALGGTSTDIGAKWGLALLDPSASNEMDQITSIDTALADRPIAYDGDTMKVLVLMSDGNNSTAYSTLPGYRHGPSGIKSIHGADNLNGMAPNSTYVEGLYYHDPSRGTNAYYRYKDGAWVSQSAITTTVTSTQSATCTKYTYGGQWYWNSCSVPTTNCTYKYQSGNTKYYTCTKTTTTVSPATLYDVSFEYLYQTRAWNLYAVADLLRRPFGRTTHEQYNVMALQSENILGKNLTTKDDRLSALCTQAKRNGVIIFTVAADAPEHGAQVLQDCATSETYAYDVTGDNLATAFSSIANSITALRLTN